MKKLAFFVEGQTESIFIKKLLLEIAGKKNISVKQVVAKKKLIELRSLNIKDKINYFVLIVDCHGDESVKSKILDNRSNLLKANYDLILGLRDVYPIDKVDIEKLKKGLRTRVPTKDIPIEICLAVMEIEAWFLQEQNHYEKIDANLTLDRIRTETNFNPVTDNAEAIDHPSELLRSIYRIVGKGYNKTKTHVNRTVEVIDYENLYLKLPEKLSYFQKTLSHIDGFLS